MATVNFYLKDPKSESETLIFMFFSFDKQRVKYSTGESILQKDWNAESQRARKSSQGYYGLNNYLEQLEECAKEIYRNAVIEGAGLSTIGFKTELLKRLNKNTEIQKGFFDYFQEYIDISKPTKKQNTINKFITLTNHLKAYEKQKKQKLSFEILDMKFYENLVAYFINDLKLLNNTFGKYITALKTFLHWSKERGYNSNFTFIKFKAPKEDSDIIYLTEIELMDLYAMDLSKTKRLENARDVFCFGCFTGLRYSDISRLKKENVFNEQLNFVTQKTRDSLKVPLNDFAKEILEKYDFKLPVISNQNTNVYLKELGKLAGISDEILLTKYRGAEEIQFKKPKYHFISSHTARRTFVTLSLEKGMRAETVMGITGHKDYKTLKKYIKITDKIKVVEMKQIWSKSSLLKIV